jgi:hypothetical protein
LGIKMTTIACNRNEIAADTNVTWEGVGKDSFRAIKIFAGKKAIYGITGGDSTGSLTAIEWLRKGVDAGESKPLPPEYEHTWDWKIIELSRSGIAVYNEYLEREICEEPCLAVGSGRKVALYCMKYLHMSPAEAVREACRVDLWSEVPIFHAALSDMKIKEWKLNDTEKPKPRSR